MACVVRERRCNVVRGARVQGVRRRMGAQVKVRWARRPSRWWFRWDGGETEQEAHEWVEAPWEEVRPSGKGTLRLDWEVQGECGA